MPRQLCLVLTALSCLLFLQLAAAAEIDEEPVSKAKQSRSEKKARKVRGWHMGRCACGQPLALGLAYYPPPKCLAFALGSHLGQQLLTSPPSTAAAGSVGAARGLYDFLPSLNP